MDIYPSLFDYSVEKCARLQGVLARVSAPCGRLCGAQREVPHVEGHCCPPVAISEPPQLPS